MAQKQKMWTWGPAKQPKSKIPENTKRDLETKANDMVESFLKPTYIKPPSKDKDFNYIIDILTKWYRSYFYFCSKYHCPSPNAISPFFEDKFARLEYIGNNCFNLAFMRHTGQWWEIYTNLYIDECLAIIKEDPNFEP
jgi:hypothetical protein